MKTVILCGGQGTRLREETEHRPKPLVDVGGRPILWHIMKTYAAYGHRDFVCCLGYKGDKIKEYFLAYEELTNDLTVTLGARRSIEYHGHHGEQDLRITLADTGVDSMTGGRIRRAAKYIDGDRFMVTYGDGLSDIDINKVVDFHVSHGRLATMSVVRPTSRFGVVSIEDGGRVSQFVEKPRIDGWVNAGFFVMERAVLDLIADDDTVLEKEPLERLARENQLMAYQHEGFFFAMDTYRDYLAVNALWREGKAPWKVWD